MDSNLDFKFYRVYYCDLNKMDEAELNRHWLDNGKNENRFPNFNKLLHSMNLKLSMLPVDFDANKYLELNPSLEKNGVDNVYNAVIHYLKKGKFEKRSYKITIDGNLDLDFYKNWYSDLKNLNNDELVNHWSDLGRKEKRFPNISELLNHEKIDISWLPEDFNHETYLSLNKNVLFDYTKTKYHLMYHFLKVGINDNLAYKKSPFLFSDEHVIKQISDNQLNENQRVFKKHPFLFYTKFGKEFGIIPHILFEKKYVASKISISGNDPYACFLEKVYENKMLSCHPLFDSDFYSKRLEVLGIKTKLPLIEHYLNIGWKKGIDPHPMFDSEYYRNILGFANFTSAPLIHYLENSNFLVSPTPFVDLKYYNHVCYSKNICLNFTDALSDFAVRDEWIPFHNEISQQSIGPIIKDADLIDIKYRDNDITISDFIEIIKTLRASSLSLFKKTKKNIKIKLSVIMLNYNNMVQTILSAYCAHLALKKISHELILVDNGSDFFIYKTVLSYLNVLENFKVIRLERNRYFGEGNNIALEQAKGHFISFLNNDAYVNRSVFVELLKTFEKNKVIGAAAPVFLQQNYSLQECGGIVSGCGQVIQIGKDVQITGTFDDILASLPNYVDYCSAACCVIKKQVLEQVGGFDYIFEPFYYEDTDLFSRIRCAGFKLYVEKKVHVMHFENTSTKKLLNDDFHSLISTNKQKFSSRWFGNLEKGTSLAEDTPRIKLFNHHLIDQKTKSNITAFVYTPFSLGPGGGEKYIISLALALSKKYQTTLIFNEIHSLSRLKMVAEDLNILLSNVSILTWDRALKEKKPDLFVAMGNEIIPPVPAIGNVNVFHCQFPFPLENTNRPDGLETLEGYDSFLVNSNFTKNEINRQLFSFGLEKIPVHINYPPCWDGDIDDKLQNLKKKQSELNRNTLSILNVGRFFKVGHNKRQDVVIDIHEKLKNIYSQGSLKVTTTLVGAVNENEKDYFIGIAQRCHDLNVSIKSNVERHILEEAYFNSNLYIHAAGYSKQEGYSPHELEHFGITVVEAMINGTIPLVYRAGGPYEIISKVGIGQSFESIDEAIDKIAKILENDNLRSDQEQMILNCSDFSAKAFNSRIEELFL